MMRANVCPAVHFASSDFSKSKEMPKSGSGTSHTKFTTSGLAIEIFPTLPAATKPSSDVSIIKKPGKLTGCIDELQTDTMQPNKITRTYTEETVDTCGSDERQVARGKLVKQHIEDLRQRKLENQIGFANTMKNLSKLVKSSKNGHLRKEISKLQDDFERKENATEAALRELELAEKTDIRFLQRQVAELQVTNRELVRSIREDPTMAGTLMAPSRAIELDIIQKSRGMQKSLETKNRALQQVLVERAQQANIRLNDLHTKLSTATAQLQQVQNEKREVQRHYKLLSEELARKATELIHEREKSEDIERKLDMSDKVKEINELEAVIIAQDEHIQQLSGYHNRAMEINHELKIQLDNYKEQSSQFSSDQQKNEDKTSSVAANRGVDDAVEQRATPNAEESVNSSTSSSETDSLESCDASKNSGGECVDTIVGGATDIEADGKSILIEEIRSLEGKKEVQLRQIVEQQKADIVDHEETIQKQEVEIMQLQEEKAVIANNLQQMKVDVSRKDSEVKTIRSVEENDKAEKYNTLKRAYIYIKNVHDEMVKERENIISAVESLEQDTNRQMNSFMRKLYVSEDDLNRSIEDRRQLQSKNMALQEEIERLRAKLSDVGSSS